MGHFEVETTGLDDHGRAMQATEPFRPLAETATTLPAARGPAATSAALGRLGARLVAELSALSEAAMSLARATHAAAAEYRAVDRISAHVDP